MQDNVIQALQILMIGMGTVFLILTLVVLLSKLLIFWVNRFTPDMEVQPLLSNNGDHWAVIHGVVDHLTNGQGVITHIQSKSKEE